MRRLRGLLLAVLLLPAAAAESANGSFVVSGGMDFPAQSDLRFSPLALLQEDLSALDGLVATFPRAVVHHFVEESIHVEASSPIQYVRDTTHTPHRLTNVEVRLAGAPSDFAFLGLYPAAGASARLDSSTDFVLQGRERSEVRSGETTAADEDPLAGSYLYYLTVAGSHLYAEAPGSLRYEGRGFLKVMGDDVVVRSDEGARRFETGHSRADDLPVTRFYRKWVVIEFEQGVLEGSSTSPWVFAAQDTQAAFAGDLTFRPVSGSLDGARATYLARGGVHLLQGEFTADLSPIGAGFTKMGLAGTVGGTDLVAQSVAVGSAPSGGAFLLLLVVGVVAGFGGGAFFVSRRGFLPPAAPGAAPDAPFTAEDCCDAGAKAASEENWAVAVKWFRRAHSLAPRSGRICGDLAFSLSQIGEVDEALRMYEEAARLTSDGEAEFNAALAALHGGRPAEDVEAWLDRALEREPALVVPLDADQDFRMLEGRPRYEAAVGRAWERLGAPR